MSALPAETEQALAELSDDDFSALIKRVRPPAETTPSDNRPPARLPGNWQPSPDEQAAHKRYSDSGYPPAWGYQRGGQ